MTIGDPDNGGALEYGYNNQRLIQNDPEAFTPYYLPMFRLMMQRIECEMNMRFAWNSPHTRGGARMYTSTF
jgi:hypothetical protein